MFSALRIVIILNQILKLYIMSIYIFKISLNLLFLIVISSLQKLDVSKIFQYLHFIPNLPSVKKIFLSLSKDFFSYYS